MDKKGIDKKIQRDQVVDILNKTYPGASIVLHYTNPWELLVAVILSAQCTDIMVNKVTARVFLKYKTLDEYVNAPLAEFEKDIQSTGFYHNKAKNILASAKIIRDTFGGVLPKTMEEMITLPGVARKTANVVLGNAYGVVEGIAVDTHVLRLSQRLRLVEVDTIGGKKPVYIKRSNLSQSRTGLEQVIDYKKDADPVKIERQLMETIPKDTWFKLTYLLIDHGRAVCKAQHPTCGVCVLRTLCPAFRL